MMSSREEAERRLWRRQWLDAEDEDRARMVEALGEADPELLLELRRMEAVEAELRRVAQEEEEDLARLEPREGDAKMMQQALERTAPLRSRERTTLLRRPSKLGLAAAAGLLAMLWLVLSNPRTPPSEAANPTLGPGDGATLIAPRDSVKSWGDVEFQWTGIPENAMHVQVVIEPHPDGELQRSGPVRGERWRPSATFVETWGDRIEWTIEIEIPGADLPTVPQPVEVRLLR